MTDLATLTAQLEDLRAARASGVRRVEFRDRTVEYRTDNELAAANRRASLVSQLFGDEARALGPLLTNLGLLRESLGIVVDETTYAGSATREL